MGLRAQQGERVEQVTFKPCTVQQARPGQQDTRRSSGVPAACAPDVVVRLPGGGHERVGKGGERGVRAVPPVRLVLLHAMDVDLVVPCARMRHATGVCHVLLGRCHAVMLLSTRTCMQPGCGMLRL